MEIRFRKPLPSSHLCLMASVSANVFKSPFILSQTNIKRFTNLYRPFDGKFVFDKEAKKIALSLGENLRHEEMAQSSFGEANNKKMIGALLSFEKTDSVIKFELYGGSGFFGKPSEQDLNLVANYIQELLRSIKFSPAIEKEEKEKDCVIIRSEFPGK